MKSGNTNNHGSSRANISMVLLLLIVYFIFGFSPFNWKLWTPKVFDNGGVMLAQELRIQSPGIVNTPEAPEWLAKVKETTSLRVLLEIQSDHRKQYGPARIFTVSDDPYRRNLTVAQQGSDLVIRLWSPDTTLNGVPEHVVHNLFGIFGWHNIELTVEPMFLKMTFFDRKYWQGIIQTE